MVKVYLALDNCFAVKRWVRPADWAPIYRRLGVEYIEASADVELDPLLMDRGYLKRWESEARSACRDNGLSIATFYSGHGTYATTGLMHHDPGARRRVRDEWIADVARRAGRFGAGVGFFVHALDQEMIEDRELYAEALEELIEELALVAEMAASVPELTTASVEQMYSPHQPPWRVEDTRELLAAVYSRSGGYPLYTTLDLGHGGPQHRFLPPRKAQLIEAITTLRGGSLGEARRRSRLPYLGTLAAGERLLSLAEDRTMSPEAVADEVLSRLEGWEHLFADRGDADPYQWLRRLGPWSPVIHLQQSDGSSSGHRPFTREENAGGIIEPKRVLEALAEGFEAHKAADGKGMPPAVDKVYLTLELFASTAAYPAVLLGELEESVACWREAIPQDGLSLTELV